MRDSHRKTGADLRAPSEYSEQPRLRKLRTGEIKSMARMQQLRLVLDLPAGQLVMTSPPSAFARKGLTAALSGLAAAKRVPLIVEESENGPQLRAQTIERFFQAAGYISQVLTTFAEDQTGHIFIEGGQA